MFFPGAQAGHKGWAVLAACALAGLAAVAGCTSGGGAQAALPHSLMQGAGQGQPSWAALGSGVTVDPPVSASPGTGSPQEVLIGLVTAFSAGHFTDLCKYEEPSSRSGCISAWSPSDVDFTLLPFFKNVKPGYTAINGDKALIGFTGTVCILKESPSCFTNNDPAAILDSGQSFSMLWRQSLMSAANAYSLTCVPQLRLGL
jgi:hypothetical protein